MMMSSKSYIKSHESDTFEQLIEERNELVNEIKKLEKIVFSENERGELWDIDPNPDVFYQMYLSYLAELCKFMQEKYNRECIL